MDDQQLLKQEIVASFSALSGITVRRAFDGPDAWYVQFSSENSSSLAAICRAAGAANCPVQIGTDWPWCSGPNSDFYYTLVGKLNRIEVLAYYVSGRVPPDEPRH